MSSQETPPCPPETKGESEKDNASKSEELQNGSNVLDDLPQESAEDSKPRSVVKQFFRRGEAFIEELLDENEKLRLRVMHLESELHQNKASVPPAKSINELQSILQKLKQEHEELRRRYDEILGETKEHKSRYEQIEEENEKLVNLFVASYQLHSTIDLEEAVQIVTEILLNFVGAGQFALFMRENQELLPISSYGIPMDKLATISMKEEWVENCFETGRPQVNSKSLRTPGSKLTEPLVCLPLNLEGKTTGAIMIYSFLQQKASISPIDMELFNLLSDHTPVVLEGARLFKEASENPAGAKRYKALLKHEDTP